MTFYTFANATTSIPLANLDANFATPITLGNTAVTINGTFSSIGNLTLNNATIASGNSTVTKETVTTITSPASTALTIQSAGTTAMTIDTSQNVGIGTTSPAAHLDLGGNFYSGTPSTLSQAINNLSLYTASGTPYYGFGVSTNFLNITGGEATAGIRFNTGGVNERMRIDSSGNLLVGTTDSGRTSGIGIKLNPAGYSTTPTVSCVGSISTNSADTYHVYSTGASAYRFYVGYGGTINATSTSITGISDSRLKENVAAIQNGLDTVTKLNPVTYNFKDLPVCDDGKIQHYGFLAQEVQTLLPTLVTEGLNKAEDGSKYLTLKMGDILPVLVAAIQELSAKVTALEAKVGA